MSTYVVAGNYNEVNSNENIATKTLLSYPEGIFITSLGELFVADSGNLVIRRVDLTSGNMSIVAEQGSLLSFTMENGLARSIALGYPMDMIGDSNGNIFFTDNSAFLVRMLSYAPPTISPSASPTIVPFVSRNPTNRPVTQYPSMSPTQVPVNISLIPIPKYTISTVIGTTITGNSVGGLPGWQTNLRALSGVWMNSIGILFIVDQYAARTIPSSPVNAISQVFAGSTSSSGDSGDYGPATSALFTGAFGVCGLPNGHVYITDYSKKRIRKVVNGIIYPVVGKSAGSACLDGSGTSVLFKSPFFCSSDNNGNILIADSFCHSIRLLNVTTNTVTTIIVTSGISGNTNGIGTNARLLTPYQPFVDTIGNIYIAEYGNNLIRKQPAGFTSSTVVVAGTGTTYTEKSLATNALLNKPTSIYVDPYGNLFIADSSNYCIRMLNASTGYLTTISGTGVQGTGGADNILSSSSSLGRSFALVADTLGNIFFSDVTDYRVRKLTPGSPVSSYPTLTPSLYPTLVPTIAPSTLPTNSPTTIPSKAPVKSLVQKYTISTLVGTGVSGNSPSGTNGLQTGITGPNRMWLNSNGVLFFSDKTTVRSTPAYATNGIVTVVAGTPGVTGFSGDLSFAVSASLNIVKGICTLTDGRLYIADSNNYRIRMVINGIISTVIGSGTSSCVDGVGTAASLSLPSGMFCDTISTVYFADATCNTIRKFSADSRVVTTLIGQRNTAGFLNDIGTFAKLKTPLSLFLDTIGNIYFADYGNNRIRMQSAGLTSPVVTIAGTGEPLSMDNVTATLGGLNNPTGVFVDSNGNIFIADSGNGWVRQINSTTRVMSHIAGNRLVLLDQDNVLATTVNLTSPNSIIADSFGYIFFSDSGNNRIRKLTLGDPVSAFPTVLPSIAPSVGPTVIPTLFPTAFPSISPTYTAVPTKLPTCSPTTVPSELPSELPSMAPVTKVPTACPTLTPTSFLPTRFPSAFPTEMPSIILTLLPSESPTLFPTSPPTPTPSRFPTFSPSIAPTILPSEQPSVFPRCILQTTPPSFLPSSSPITIRSTIPSTKPSEVPTKEPTVLPTTDPSLGPTLTPTNDPSMQPTVYPSVEPTLIPTNDPSLQPTADPSMEPTLTPTNDPSMQPTVYPSVEPTLIPTNDPSLQPTADPSMEPTLTPTNDPSMQPTVYPSVEPTLIPTNDPSLQPTADPSMEPTFSPSDAPSRSPSHTPTVIASTAPSNIPSLFPHIQPTNFPSFSQTDFPSIISTATLTVQPSSVPTNMPSPIPSELRTTIPTNNPTLETSILFPPTNNPSVPSLLPTFFPSSKPITSSPSSATTSPSTWPSLNPSTRPSSLPSNVAPEVPNYGPTSFPFSVPSSQPSGKPTGLPTSWPSSLPSLIPSGQPTHRPTSQPTSQPSRRPTSQPTSIPSCQPTSRPSASPSVTPTLFVSPTPIPSQYPTPSTSSARLPTVKPSFIPSCSPTSTLSAFPDSRTFKGWLFMFGGMVGSQQSVHSNIYLTGSYVGRSYVVLGKSKREEDVTLQGQSSSEGVMEVSDGGVQLDSVSRSTTNVGDINRDGKDDWVLGDPSSSRGYVLFGETSSLTNLRVSVMLVESADSSSSTRSGLGWACAGLGDMNVDGFGDFIITAPTGNVAYVVYGRARRNFPSQLVLSLMSSRQGYKIVGSGRDRSFGLSVSSGGDFNGDGRGDILISALRSSSSSQATIYVIVGNGSSVIGGAGGGVSGNPLVSVDGLGNSSYFKIVSVKGSFTGLSVSWLGDMDGDGYDDVGIGSAPYQSGGSVEQQTYVVYGRDWVGSRRDVTTNGNVLWLSGLRSGVDGFVVRGGGFMVSGLGDVDGDGLSDMMVSSYGGWLGKGNAYITVFPTNITHFPSMAPSSRPSSSPSSYSTNQASFPPNMATTTSPSRSPVLSNRPTFSPSRTRPTTVFPSLRPTTAPTIKPTMSPSVAIPTLDPSVRRTKKPITPPTSYPSTSFPTEFVTQFSSQEIPLQIKVNNTGSFHPPNVVGGATKNLMISVNGSVRIMGSQGRTIYTILRSDDGNTNSEISIEVFRDDYDQLDLSSFPEYRGLGDLPHESPPLRLLLSSRQSVVLENHRSFDLSASSVVFAGGSSGSSSSSSSLHLSKKQQEGALVVASLFCALIVMAVGGRYYYLLRRSQEDTKEIKKRQESIRNLVPSYLSSSTRPSSVYTKRKKDRKKIADKSVFPQYSLTITDDNEVVPKLITSAEKEDMIDLELAASTRMFEEEKENPVDQLVVSVVSASDESVSLEKFSDNDDFDTSSDSDSDSDSGSNTQSQSSSSSSNESHKNAEDIPTGNQVEDGDNWDDDDGDDGDDWDLSSSSNIAI